MRPTNAATCSPSDACCTRCSPDGRRFKEKTIGTLYQSANNTFDQVGPIPQGGVVKGNGFVSYFPTLTTQRAPQPNFGRDTSLPDVFTNQVVKDASGNIVFQNAAPGSVGNMNYYASSIRGPGMLSFNAAMTKSIRITEGKTFTLRVDAVNVLNKPQWFFLVIAQSCKSTALFALCPRPRKSRFGYGLAQARQNRRK